MLDSLSPYALLQASKPRQPNVVTTAYDLFSAVQSSSPTVAGVPQERSPEAPAAAPATEAPAAAASMPLVPRSRTHYISDIKHRHSEALRRAYPLHP